jgi:hypothetical protein
MAYCFFSEQKTKKLTYSMQEDGEPNAAHVTTYVFMHAISNMCEAIMANCSHPSSVYEVIEHIIKMECKDAILKILKDKFPNEIKETDERVTVSINISDVDDDELIKEILFFNKIIREDNKKL